jgi:hypothetical protein
MEIAEFTEPGDGGLQVQRYQREEKQISKEIFRITKPVIDRITAKIQTDIEKDCISNDEMRIIAIVQDFISKYGNTEEMEIYLNKFDKVMKTLDDNNMRIKALVFRTMLVESMAIVQKEKLEMERTERLALIEKGIDPDEVKKQEQKLSRLRKESILDFVQAIALASGGTYAISKFSDPLTLIPRSMISFGKSLSSLEISPTQNEGLLSSIFNAAYTATNFLTGNLGSASTKVGESAESSYFGALFLTGFILFIFFAIFTRIMRIGELRIGYIRVGFKRTSRKSPRKPRKSPRKLRKSARKPRKSARKLRKSTRKSTRKPRKSARKLRKSPRKSARKSPRKSAKFKRRSR